MQKKPVVKAGRVFRAFLVVLYLMSFAVYFYSLWDGIEYYRTAYQERPRHEDYRNLRPAGNRAHTFGVVGTLMMLLMLLYSVRKRTKIFKNLFPISYWLKVHIYFGIMGPLLIILHTSFKVQGLVAVSFWSMVAVALSGVLGRYLYLQIPRTFGGNEMSFQEINELNRDLTRQLLDEFKLSEEELNKIEESLSSEPDREKGIFASLFTLILTDLLRPIRFYRLKKSISKELHLPAHTLRKLLQLSHRKALLQRRMIFLNKVQQLFHYWHVFHKPFAIIMFLILFVHILVAVLVGYTWLF